MTDELYTLADATCAADDAADDALRARLVVYSDDGPDAGTRLIDIPVGAEVTFGRTRTATVFIDSERVSRLHARIRRDESVLTIEDLGSRNGTRVNGARIAGPTALASGDEISIGPVTALVNLTTRAPRRVSVGSSSYFEERLAAEVSRGRAYNRRLALIMLRIEGSADATDATIARVAAELRPMDIVAEYGPDELALLLVELSAPEAEEAAARIARVASGVDDAGHTPGEPISVRLGLALFPDHASAAGKLLSRARDALRLARAEGRSLVPVPPAEDVPVGPEIVVADPQMRRVLQLVHKVAPHPMTVTITGETGVGKEVIAEEIHRASPRRDRPFLKLNCASIPETLLESELFGHERGAFTGADRQKRGYFEAAEGGTIFLDEIGETSLAIQAKLLRVLEERRFTRVGSTEERAVDVRILCATNRDLEEEVRRGRFREDLFFRVSAFTIAVPPLRDRRSEIPLLAEQFIARCASNQGSPRPELSPAALAALTRYDWPGNVRELRNAIERAVVLHGGPMIQPGDLPERIRDLARMTPDSGGMAAGTGAGASAAAGAVGAGRSVDDEIAAVERAALVAALESCAGNQTRAAQLLGVSRRALIYRMEKHGLKPLPDSRLG